MNDLSENNAIKFVNISKKKAGIFANFKVKGIRGGATFSANISVDLSSAEVDTTDPLEKIIDACARLGVREFKRSEFEFAGITSI